MSGAAERRGRDPEGAWTDSCSSSRPEYRCCCLHREGWSSKPTRQEDCQDHRLRAGQLERQDKTSQRLFERAKTKTRRPQLTLSPRVISRQPDPRLVQEPSDLNIRRRRDPLDPRDRARRDRPCPVEVVAGAVRHHGRLDVADRAVRVGRAPQAKVVDVVHDEGLARRGVAGGGRVADVVPGLGAASDGVGVYLVRLRRRAEGAQGVSGVGSVRGRGGGPGGELCCEEEAATTNFWGGEKVVERRESELLINLEYNLR